MRKFDTKVQHLKYKVLREVAKQAWADTLQDNLLDIPTIIVPGKVPTMRCCVYKERAILNERVKLAMGGNKKNPNVIEVIDIACDECPMGGYEVTNACRGCLAHRCEDVCRFGAISLSSYGVAEVDERMDAILSIDTTKGNRILNARGIAITPTVKDGYLLRTSEDLLSILESTTGCLPMVLPLTQQDITPYGNDVYHLNSILQPSVATESPCVGVAITTQSQVAGCATGATHVPDVDEAVRFSIEVAQAYTAGKCHFYDSDEYQLLVSKYGTLSHFRTMGK